MRRRRVIKFSVAGAALVGVILFVQHTYFPSPLQYRGDGKFHYHTGVVLLSPLRGYTVTMPEFDLSEPHQAEYRFALLGNLPNDCDVLLIIPERDHDLWSNSKKFDGQLQLDVLDSQAREVMHARGRLGDFIWRWETGGLNGLWQEGNSSFRPNDSEDYRVRISYTPDPRLAGYKGFLYFESQQPDLP